jgi:hypothetical protein
MSYFVALLPLILPIGLLLFCVFRRGNRAQLGALVLLVLVLATIRLWIEPWTELAVHLFRHQ